MIKVTKIVNDKEISVEFESQLQCADFLGIKPSNVCNYLGDGKFHKDLKFDKVSNTVDGSTDWFFDSKGKYRHNINNYYKYLSESNVYKGKFAKDKFTEEISFNGSILDQSGLVSVKRDMEIFFNGDPINESHLEDAIEEVSKGYTYHPILDRINKVQWDGVSRLEDLFIKKIGCDDTPYNRKISKMFFINSYRRLVKPGCDNPFCLIITGKQGKGKTAILKWLSYGKQLEFNVGSDQKEYAEHMKNNWFFAINELSESKKGNTKNGMDILKQVITMNDVDARLAYRRDARKFPSHCVFVSTTNNDYFLRDYSQIFERRFYILKCNGEDKDSYWYERELTDYVRNQVWAEAKYLYDTYGENLYMELNSWSEEEKEELAKIQSKHKSCRNDTELRTFVEMVSNEDFNISHSCLTNYINWNAALSKMIRGDYACYQNDSYKQHAIPVDWVIRRLCKSSSKYYYYYVFEDFGWEMKDIKYYDGIVRECFVKKQYSHLNDINNVKNVNNNIEKNNIQDVQIPF